jgi:transcriptional regulator with XRE-family HTH domain
MFALCGNPTGRAFAKLRKNGLAESFAVCEKRGMANPSSEFAAKAGISVSYASEILSGARTPSLTLAISIFQKTGRKFGPISEATDEQIATMAEVYGVAA